MAIDTHEKRRNVAGVARPWMRSKLPGSTNQAWRMATGNTYGGNELLQVPDAEGLQWVLDGSPAHWTIIGSPAHWTITGTPLHWTIEE